MPGIFISYRRQDSQSAAGRLADHLKEHLHGVQIFRDVETIEPGVDFVDAIDRALAACGVLLAVIGPRWLNVTGQDGQRRLDNPGDYTRIEIASALARSDVRVIPVLVEGAEMPVADALPDDLKALARRNAIELADKRWDYDVSQLIETLYKALGLDPHPLPRPEPIPAPTPAPAPKPFWRSRWGIAGGVVAAILVASLVSEPDPLPPPTPPDPIDPITPPQPAAPTLSGNWQDAEGGRYELLQQGAQVAFRGMSPHGPVAGQGVVQGWQLALNYTVNGYPYQAALQYDATGRILQGQYRSPVTGEYGPVLIQRAP